MRLKVIIVLVVGCCAFVWVRNARDRRMPRERTSEITWMTDAPAAQATAHSENKVLLMNFTGSDWCGWCIRLDKEVFATPEFATYAQKNLVLLKLDFPRALAQSAEEARQNDMLSRRYGVSGYPTIVVLKPNGEEKGRLGYRPGGPKRWLAALADLR